MESTQCQVCGAFFIDKTSLDEHIESSHSKEELYSCILCLKTTLVQFLGQARIPLSSDSGLPDRTNLDPVSVDLTVKINENGVNSEHDSSTFDDNKVNNHVTDDKDHVTNNCDHVTSYVTVSENHVSSNDGQVGNYVTGARDTVHDDQMSSQIDHVAYNNDHVTVDNDHVTGSGVNLSLHLTDQSNGKPEEISKSRDYLYNPDIDEAVPDKCEEDHVVEGRYFCRYCKKEFSTNYALKRHVMSHYDNRPNKCDICGKAFIGKQNLQVHYRIHTGEKPYKCQYCHKKFTQYGTLYRHTQLHLRGRLGGTAVLPIIKGEKPESLKDDNSILSKETDDEMDQSDDIIMGHGGQDERLAINEEPMDLQKIKQRESTSVIDFTGNIHNNVQHEKQFDGTERSSSMDTDNSNLQIDHNMPIGEKNVDVDDRLDLGIIQKVGERKKISENVSVVSNIPGNSDSTSKSDEASRKEDNSKFVEHNQVLLYSPGSNKTNVQTAMSVDPANHKIENTGINMRYNNTEHIELSAEVPLENVNKDQHKLHRDLNAQVISEFGSSDINHVSRLQPHCDFCNIMFNSMEDLHSHQSLHRERGLHKCLVCGKYFTTSCSLRRHTMTHTGEKPHHCDVCGKGFIEKQHLQAHYRTHTGEKPYKCHVCEKHFAQYGTLHNHLQTHKYRENQQLPREVILPDGTNGSNNDRQREITIPNFPTDHLPAHKYREDLKLQREVILSDGKNEANTDWQREPTVPEFSKEGMNDGHSEENGNFEPPLYPERSGNTKTNFESREVYIKQEVQSDEDDAQGETKIIPNSHKMPIDLADGKSYSLIENLRNKSKICNGDANDHVVANGSITLPAIKQEVFEQGITKTLQLPDFSKHVFQQNFMAQYEASKNLLVNNRNQLPGIASFTSNHSNMSFLSNLGNPLLTFHLTCKFCLQIFNNNEDLQSHMQIHLSTLNSQLVQNEMVLFPSPGNFGAKNAISPDHADSNQDESLDLNDKKGNKPHKCTVCGKGYQAKYCLRRHMYVHYGEKPFKCQVCGRGFIEKQHLTIHFRIHTGEKPYECKFCGKKFTQYGTLHNHLNTHKRKGLFIGKQKRTDLSGNNAPQTDSNTQHKIDQLTVKLENNEEEFQSLNSSSLVEVESPENEISAHEMSSSNAGLNLQNGSSVIMHTKDSHSESVGTNEKNQNLGRSDPVLLNDAAYLNSRDQNDGILSERGVHNDEQKFSMSSSTQQEEKPHSKDISGVEKVQSSLNGIENSQTSDKEKDTSPYIFNCDLCKKSFYGKQNWKLHLNLHMLDSTYKCKACGKHCSGEKALQRHSLIHTGTRPHICDLCGKGFMEKQHLQIHRRIHTGEKPYKCDVCDKRFTQYGTLHKHYRIHTKDKPYKCLYCIKSFGERRQLLHHMAQHTNTTDTT